MDGGTQDHDGLDEHGEAPFDGARRPDRQYRLDANRVGIAVHEWGDADAPPLMMMHGGFDFARTFDVFAPVLADAGWRVVCWDQRGHGNSDHVELYSWDADMRDTLAVFDHVADNAFVIADSNHGFKMIGVGKLTADMLIGGTKPWELEPFTFERFATGATFGDRNSNCPWV